MGEEIAFENGRISNFQGLVTLTLDLVILHAIMHRSSPLPTHLISLKSKELFADVWTGRWTFETTLLGRLRGVDLITQHLWLPNVFF